MPYINSIDREEFLEIKVPGGLFDRTNSNWLEDSYFVADSRTAQKYVRPGLIVAVDTDTNKYVPYNVSASYGTGSDTAVGILDTFEILTLGEVAVAPLYHGKVIEAHCYIFGGALGTITAAVKSDLPDIHWAKG